jgi:hypothetical protein
MMRVVVMATLLVAPAAVANAGVCALKEREQVESRVTYSTGVTETVMARQGEQIFVRIDAGKETWGSLYHAGIVPLLRDGQSFMWATTLPATDQLIPGATFRLEGQQVTKSKVVPVAMDLRVIEETSVMVGGCPYSGLKIATTEWRDGHVLLQAEQILILPALLVIGVTVAGDTGPETVLATGLE